MSSIQSNNNQRSIPGFSLMEILVVLGILTIVITSIIVLAIDISKFTENSSRKVDSAIASEELMSALLLSKKDLWSSIIDNTNDGPKHLSFQDSQYTILDGPITRDLITSSFELGDVYRDSSGNIVQTGGILDINSRVVTVEVSWTDLLGIVHSEINQIYISNWASPQWLQTSIADFTSGEFSTTVINGALGGEIELESTTFPDWCEPENNVSSYEIPGDGWPQNITAEGDNATMSTRTSTSGTPFTRVSIIDADPPIVSLDDNYDDGNWITDHYPVSNNVFLASSNNSKELTVIDIGSSPYSEVAYYDAPFWSDANAVWVDTSTDTGYIGQVRKFISVDIDSPPSGVLSELDILDYRTTSGRIDQIVIRDGYAYLMWINSDRDIRVVDVSDPTNMVEVATINYATVNPSRMDINDTGDRLYYATVETSGDEVHIVDISDPENPSYVNGYDTNGTTVEGLSVFEEDDRLIVAGRFGEDEYHVVDISDELNLVKCGGIDFTTESTNRGVYDVDTVKTPGNNSYAYVLTGETTGEFKIIRGGPGAGAGGGVYAPSGTYVSEVFDSGTALTNFLSLDWTENIPSGTTLQLQIRIGDTFDLSGESWFGPDGTGGSYFDGQGTYIPESKQEGRYIQYQAYLTTSDSNVTPSLYDVVFIYES
ncbi:hypothetical protein KC717_02055 [Candidatus Dojkabacteria bacterium]|uniref:Prepilin-type N-terminal cleavage/methylation domain-containing protein n=1 Tax=Candidatus Dojkabacteria bacterium TaxID=2099670 RepID=A0A955L821_9BACT|nr:hypothetical protein [Candidatus Dojkabacteria bacterium]